MGWFTWSNSTTTPQQPQPPVHKPFPLTLILLGLDKAGKTTFLKRLKQVPAENTRQSWGFSSDILKLSLPQIKQKISITFYDVGGGPKIRGIWNNYLHEVHGITWVIDPESRLDESIALLQSTYMHPYVRGKPILILVNRKSNIEGDLPFTIPEKIQELIQKNDIPGAKVAIANLMADNVPAKRRGKNQKVPLTVYNDISWLIQQIFAQKAVILEKIHSDTEDYKRIQELEMQDKMKRVEQYRQQRELAEAETPQTAEKGEVVIAQQLDLSQIDRSTVVVNQQTTVLSTENGTLHRSHSSFQITLEAPEPPASTTTNPIDRKGSTQSLPKIKDLTETHPNMFTRWFRRRIYPLW